jgi:hypothetical protein
VQSFGSRFAHQLDHSPRITYSGKLHKILDRQGPQRARCRLGSGGSGGRLLAGSSQTASPAGLYSMRHSSGWLGGVRRTHHRLVMSSPSPAGSSRSREGGSYSFQVGFHVSFYIIVSLNSNGVDRKSAKSVSGGLTGSHAVESRFTPSAGQVQQSW